jgi:hypothetical protein
MSTQNPNALALRTVDEARSLAETISKSTLIPAQLVGKSADVLVQILAGRELGLEPMTAIRSIHIINGKPTLAADAMMGLVLSSGLAEYFVQTEATASSVTFETKRKGAPVAQRVTWTLEDAKRAGVTGNPTWNKYPRQMLAARCKSELARSAYPDVLAGVYDPDELAVPVRQPAPASVPVPEAEDAEVVPESGLAAEIAAANDLDALQAVASKVKASGVTGDERRQLLAAYTARRAELAA